MSDSTSSLSRFHGAAQPARRSVTASLRMWTLVCGLLTAGFAASGCATTASAGYYSEPDLVYVSPGVQVIADWNEPIFYADGFYWRNAGGVWYRSSYYSGGWAYARPPGVILSIHSPHSYRHYRPHGWAPRRGGAAPIVRGAPPPQRGFAPGVRAAPPMQAAPGPAPGRPGFGPHMGAGPGPRMGAGPGPRMSPGPGSRMAPQPGPRPLPAARARAPFMGHGHNH